MIDDRFECEKLSAVLSRSVCAERHKSGKYLICTGCSIGAEHAGIKIEPHLPKNLCVRCQRQANRLIHKTLCLSCYNRDLEIAKGKNARGNAPKRLKKPEHVEKQVYVDGEIKVIKADVVSSMEVTLRILTQYPTATCGLITQLPQMNLSIPFSE